MKMPGTARECFVLPQSRRNVAILVCGTPATIVDFLRNRSLTEHEHNELDFRAFREKISHLALESAFRGEIKQHRFVLTGAG